MHNEIRLPLNRPAPIVAYLAATRALNDTVTVDAASFHVPVVSAAQWVSNANFTTLRNEYFGADWYAQVSFTIPDVVGGTGVTSLVQQQTTESLLREAVKRFFPGASFSSDMRTDPEEGWQRTVLTARTGVNDLDQRMALEDQLYAAIVQDRLLTDALREVTIIFE